MFKHLKNNFLKINLITNLFIILISFILIFLIIIREFSFEISMNLHMIYENHIMLLDNTKTHSSPASPPLRGIPFFFTVLTLGSEDEMLYYSSNIELDSQTLNTLYETILNSTNTQGLISLDEYILYFSFFRPNTICIIDVSGQYSLLLSLFFSFLGLFCIIAILLYFISNYLALKSVKPVEQAFIRQKEFIANASHELNTPLSIIHSNLDLISLDTTATIDSQMQRIGLIQSQTRRMKDLVKNLLFLTQLDETKTNTSFKSLNLSQLTEQAVLMYEPLFFEKGIHLSYSIQPNLFINGNKDNIEQVLLILIDNAIKYIGPPFKITLHLSKSNNKEITLSCSNTGEGIPKEHLDKIFLRFHRVSSSRNSNVSGHGLGLPIAKRIIEQHKGKISATSTPSGLTTFYIKLPFSRKEQK